MPSRNRPRKVRERQNLLARVYRGKPVPLGARLRMLERLSRVFENDLKKTEAEARNLAVRKMATMTGSPLPYVEEFVGIFLGERASRPATAIPRIGNVYKWQTPNPMEEGRIARLSAAAEDYIGHQLGTNKNVDRVVMAPPLNPGFDLTVYLKRAPHNPIFVEVKLSLQPLSNAILAVPVRERSIINQRAHFFAVVTLEGVVIIPGNRAREFVRHALLEHAIDKLHAIKTSVKNARQSGNAQALVAAEQEFRSFVENERTFHRGRRSIRFPLMPLIRDRWALVRRYGTTGARRLPPPDFL